MREMLISGPIPERIIPSTLLWRAVGSDDYAGAKRTLARNGWFYLIKDDAWVCGWGHRQLTWATYK